LRLLFHAGLTTISSQLFRRTTGNQQDVQSTGSQVSDGAVPVDATEQESNDGVLDAEHYFDAIYDGRP
jgi:hypothetical protein